METTKKQFRLYDIYEVREKLGDFDTRKEVAKACKERELDTDCECAFALYKLGKDNMYHKIQNWSYSENSIKLYPRY